MMNGEFLKNVSKHNRTQRDYFESTLKRTMIPISTAYIDRQIQQMVRIGQLTLTERILEVGCGMGRYTLPLLKMGYQVEGLDLSPVLLERLQAYAGDEFSPRLYCADIINHPVELDGAFDKVIGFFTLHHLHNLPACFAAMFRLLKPGGKILFLEPNAFNPLYYLQILLSPRMTWAGDGGVSNMHRGVINPAMQRAGFRQLECFAFGFFPPFITNRTWAPPLEDALQNTFRWSGMLPFQVFYGEKP